MSAVLEKARGAAAYSPRHREIPNLAENSAARFVCRPCVSAWDARMANLKTFRLMEEDWDGDGSVAPGVELTDGAIAFAQSLQKQGWSPPDRVVAGVNGTIYLEWHTSEGYYEVEVQSPVAAEARWVYDGSDQVVVTTFIRGT